MERSFLFLGLGFLFGCLLMWGICFEWWRRPLRRANAKLRRGLGRRTREYKDIRARLRLLSSRYARMERARALAEEANRDVRGELEHIGAQKRALDARLQALTAESAALENRLETSTAENQAISARLREERAQRRELNAALQEVREQNQRLQASLGELRAQHTAAQTLLAEAKGQRDALQTQLADALQQRSRLETLLAEAQTEVARLEAYRAEAGTLNGRIAQLEEQLARADQQRRLAREELAGLQRKLGRTEAQLQAAQEDLMEIPILMSENESLQEQIDAAEARAARLDQQLSAHQKDHLRQIRGIGPTFAQRLHAAGIRSFAELAATPPERLREIAQLRPWQAVDVEAWIAAAKERVNEVSKDEVSKDEVSKGEASELKEPTARKQEQQQ